MYLKKLELITISPETTILKTLEIIERGVMGVALVIDDQFKLIGTVTDGDIRRALIKKASLNDIIEPYMCLSPIKAFENTTNYELISIMKSKSIEQIPVISENGTLIDIKTLSELVIGEEKENVLVIMAGGLGTRLRPFTHDTPKPLLPIGHKPILESIMEHAKIYGLTNIIISLNYLSDSIKNYFGDGSVFGVKISYIEEKESLGTAGALSLIKDEFNNDLFVINGDILSKINFDEMLNCHIENKNFLTVGTRTYKTQIPYGIIKQHDKKISFIEEKPTLEYIINAGIYVLSPQAISNIPLKTCFHMTNLIEKLNSLDLRVGSFLINDYWLDIGTINDYYKANIEFNNYFS